MSKKIKGNQKHLTLSDRIYIEEALSRQLNFKEIAIFLQKDPTTISKEIRKHLCSNRSHPRLRKNKCINHASCIKTNLCDNKFCHDGRLCAICKLRNCSFYCSDYEPTICEKLLKPPYACNGCPKLQTCHFDKLYYHAKYADDVYHEGLSSARSGINLTPGELDHLDALVSPLIVRGQSIAHIYAAHGGEIPCSKRTLYNYIADNALTVRNIDLPRKVRYKPRKYTKGPSVADWTFRKGRSYEDFEHCIMEYPDLNVVEMDTVEGHKGGKILLTMLFRNCSFMLAFIIDSKEQASVIQIFDMLEARLGTNRMRLLFPIILTDNGVEFRDPDSLECNKNGDIRTRVFYCQSCASWQKGRLEKNHEFIRNVVPKGKSFDEFDQKDITLMVNHINSIARASLNERTPFELAALLLDNKLFEALELYPVPHDAILLKPALLKR